MGWVRGDGRAGRETREVSDDELRFDCPRCASAVAERFYGPCAACRAELRAHLGGTRRDVDAGRYEPAMNVVPNQVATKD